MSTERRHRADRIVVGMHIDSYQIVRHLGGGLSAQVYEARQARVPRSVALKVPAGRDTAEQTTALRRELELLTTFEHPAVVPLIDAGTWQDQPYIVVGYAAGGSLWQRAGTPWVLERALAVLAPIADAIDSLHRLGIVHRDICAQNILIHANGYPWLADFSSVLLPGEVHNSAGELIVTGTPAYVAPEVVRGDRPSPASDVYAFGMVAYLLLTGLLPISGSTVEAVLANHGQVAPRIPSSINALLPPEADAALLRSIAAVPAARFESASAIVAALDRSAGTIRPAGYSDYGARPTETAAVGSGATPVAAPGLNDVADVSARLEDFVRSLPEAEQALVFALMREEEVAVGRAEVEVQDLTMRTFGPAAALLSLNDSGAAAALARTACSAEELAEQGIGSARMLTLLLDYLATTNVISRSDGAYELMPALARLYGSGREWAQVLRADWVFWSHLPALVSGAAPAQTMDTDDGSVYAGTVGILAQWFEDAAREVADVLEIGSRRQGYRVLDVGAGSGVWSGALAMRDPTLHVTALDRPKVLAVARRYAQASGTADRLTCVSGDMHTVELPTGAFNLVLLANVLHLEAEEQVVPLLRRLHSALVEGGELAIIGIIPDGHVVADEGAGLMALHLALRTPGGKIHDAGEYASWLRQAGFRPSRPRHIDAGKAGVSLLLASKT